MADFDRGHPPDALYGEHRGERTSDPRFGVALRIPRLDWVFRAFYGDYLPGPATRDRHRPACSISRQSQASLFRSPARRARREYQVGVSDSLSAAGFSMQTPFRPTREELARPQQYRRIESSFGRSPGSQAMIQGWELTLRSPRLWRRGQFHLAYSNQIAQATSPITGGLICPPAMTVMPARIPPGYSTGRPRSAKHVERGFQCESSVAGVRFDQCVLRLGLHQRDSTRAPYPGNYLPGHTTFDISLGKSFRETLLGFAHRAECGESPRRTRQ